jgi:hypothetical protein
MTELSEAVSQEEKIMVITKMVLNETKWLLEFIYHFYQTDGFQGRKGGTAVAVRKGIPHNHVDLPPLVSTEVTGYCIQIGNNEVLLASVYKSQATPEMMQTSLSSSALDISRYWQEI